MALRPQIWREKNRLDLLGGVFNQRCPATDLSIGTSLNYRYRIYGCQARILLLISRLESEMRLAGAEIDQRIFKHLMSDTPWPSRAETRVRPGFHCSSDMKTGVNELFRREAATEGSPGASGRCTVDPNSPQKGRQNMSPLSGLFAAIHSRPRAYALG